MELRLLIGLLQNRKIVLDYLGGQAESQQSLNGEKVRGHETQGQKSDTSCVAGFEDGGRGHKPRNVGDLSTRKGKTADAPWSFQKEMQPAHTRTNMTGIEWVEAREAAKPPPVLRKHLPTPTKGSSSPKCPQLQSWEVW